MPSFLALRAIAVFAVLAILSWLDLRWRMPNTPSAASRRFVYRVVLLSGLLGGCYGVVMDQITCTISEDYFRVFKEIPGDGTAELRRSVASLGFAAGMIPGLLAGLGLAAAATIGTSSPHVTESSPRMTEGQTLKFLVIPVCAMLFLAIPIAWFQIQWDPTHQREVFQTSFGTSRTSRMLAVWGIHQAAYFGGVLGTLIAVGVVSRRRAPRH